MPKDEWRKANLRKRYGPIGEASPSIKPRPIYAATKKCPKCGSAMVLRNNKATGEPFLGCSTYPICTGTAKHDERVKLRVKRPKRTGIWPTSASRTSSRGRPRRGRTENASSDMTFRVVTLPDGDLYLVDEIEVRQAVYDTLRPSKLFPVKTGLTEAEALAELAAIKAAAPPPEPHKGPYFQGAYSLNRPWRSDSLACHSSQRAAMMAHYKKHGLNIRIDRYGRPVCTDAAQRKKLMKIHGVKKLNSFNGD